MCSSDLFGAQTIVRDVISGFFLILEDQCRVGDVAVVNGQAGLVEQVNLRTVVLRDDEGTVHVFPNGEVKTLANKSKDFSYFVLTFGVGYDDDPKAGLPPMWQQYKDGTYGSKSPLKFTLLDDDTQALAKVASGYNPDIIHPCGGYIVKWKEAGLIQPLDIALLPEWDGITASLKEAGNLDGAYYHLPFDTGFTSLTYDADVIEFPDGEETWAVLLDPKYKDRYGLNFLKALAGQKLKVYNDINQNGQTDIGELKSLQEFQIAALLIDSQLINEQTDGGQAVLGCWCGCLDVVLHVHPNLPVCFSNSAQASSP